MWVHLKAQCFFLVMGHFDWHFTKENHDAFNILQT